MVSIWIDGIVSKPDKAHPVRVTGVRIEAILRPHNTHRTLADRVAVHVIVGKVLGEPVSRFDLNCLTGIHPTHEIAEVFDIRAFDSTHVLVDVCILFGVPTKLLFNYRIRIIQKDRSLMVVMGRPITQNIQVVHHPRIVDRSRIENSRAIARQLGNGKRGCCCCNRCREHQCCD